MANLFVEIEIIVYKEIVGDPVFGIYDDEGQIQDEGNDFAVKDILMEVNLELHNSRVGNHGASWAFVKTGPIKATRWGINWRPPGFKEEHMYFNIRLLALYPRWNKTIFSSQGKVEEVPGMDRFRDS
ncbi:hypothetical protein IGI04_037106 [Brassica rapa subsp. trilocularis]|uniref:Neprosin domain-containing protein n=1 Tax=Brassica rapa subsp. trilocularis TaxID=1813537 RepID=A0ABQ7LGE0_BRACM|nr:hypothetical protein IGI04_037106 [Brassica rapa subsp. trilocularis]